MRTFRTAASVLLPVGIVFSGFIIELTILRHARIRQALNSAFALSGLEPTYCLRYIIIPTAKYIRRKAT